MPSILIVDDEQEIGELLTEYLNGCGHSVASCRSAHDALDILKSKEIHLVLADIKMPGMDGIDFFKAYNNSKKSTTRFVMMTGHPDLINAQQAYTLGADELIAKPFNLDILKLMIDYLLETDDAYGSEKVRYFAIPIVDFMMGNHHDCSVYLKINYKFMCVTKTGQEFTAQRLQNLSAKGVTHVYLNAVDYAKYADLPVTKIETEALHPLDNAKQVFSHQRLTLLAAQQPILSQLDKKFTHYGLRSLQNFSQVIFNHSNLSRLFDSYKVSCPIQASKNVLVAVLSTSIADLWRWTSPQIQSRLVLGSLLCDIGLNVDSPLSAEKASPLTAHHLPIDDKHSERSFEILKQIKDLPEEIGLIALQHHENMSGTGYPSKLDRDKTHSFSKLIHGVSEFVEALSLHPDKADAKDAINHLLKSQKKNVSEQVLKSLYLVFNLPIPLELQNLLLPDKTSRIL